MRCEKCGIDYNPQLERCPNCGASAAHGGKTEFYGRAINSKVSIGDFFKGVFDKHPKGTAIKLFMSGTPETTPQPNEMLAQWQRPWLFARLLLVGIVFVLLCGIMIFLQQDAGYTTLWTMGSLIIPLTILTFYWEINIPRDIPIYTVIGVFFIGGTLSLVITLVLSDVINSQYGQFAWFAPVYEEPAKFLAAAIFIKKINPKYGFGGILLGGAVGAGFAAFENIMYVIRYLDTGLFFMRALYSFGGHSIWAAMYCGALVLEKGSQSLSVSHFFKKKTLIYFGSAFGLHFLWNSNQLGSWAYIVLTVVGIIVLFSVIKTCLTQVVQTAEMARFNPNVPPVSFASGSQSPQYQQQEQNPYTTPHQNIMPQQNYTPQQNVMPQQNYIPQQNAVPQQNYVPQQNTMPQQNFAPQQSPIPMVQPQVSAAVAVKTAQLVGISGPLQGRTIDFSDEIIIGRDPAQCSAVLPANTPGISRKHCSVRIAGNSLMITDHGSSSGTFLSNGQRVPSGQYVPLNGVFYLGNQQNMFSVNIK